MKKRFISKLLMAALVVVTMGVFSSCKDYDDDINANTALINQLQSQVKALEEAKATLTKQLSDANQDIITAQNTANQALKDLETAQSNLQKAIDDGDQAAINEAKSLIAIAKQQAIDAANEEAANLAKAAALEVKTDLLNQRIQDLADLNKAIDAQLSEEEFKKALEDLVTVEGMNNALEPILKGIADLQSDKANQTEVTEISKKLDELYDKCLGEGEESLKSAIALLEARIAAIEKDYVTLQGMKDYVDPALSKLDEKYATIQALTTLEQTLNQNYYDKAYINKIDGRLGKVEKDLADALGVMATQQDLKDLSDRIKEALDKKADAATMKELIDGINETIKTLAKQKDLEALSGTVSDILDKQLPDILRLINDLQTASDKHALKDQVTQEINRLDGRIDQLVTPKQLQDAIDAMMATIMADLGVRVGKLETQIAGKADKSQVESLLGVIGNLAEGKTVSGEISRLEGLINSINTTINAPITGLNTRVGNIETELGNLQTALNEIANEILNNLPELPDFTTEEQASGSRMYLGANAAASTNSLATVLTSMANNINALYSSLSQMDASVKQSLDNLTLFVTKNLTSLVYRPEVGASDDVAYLYGFPIIRAMLLEPQQVYQNFQFKVATPAAGATVDQNKRKLYYGDKWNYADTYKMSGNDLKSKQFDVIAKYWLNPSSTDISKYKWGFDEVAGKNTITRGNRDTEKAVISANVIGVDDKGILSVALKLKYGENVNDAKTVYDRTSSYAWITTVALQAVRNDANIESKDTVTSDYAIIVPDYMDDLLLAYNKYEAPAPHQKGNNKFHIQTEYANLMAENDLGIFSDSLEYNADDVVDLTKIDIHYNGDQGVMSHKDAIARGFSFEYEILTNKDIFNLDVKTDENKNETAATISLYADKKVIASVGKVANVRVKLMADGSCFAYGYISIIVTNVKKTVPVPVPNLVLQCPGDFQSKIKWADLEKAIKDVVGPSFSFDNYQIDLTAALQKVDENGNALTTDIAASVLKKEKINNVDYLTWTFTEELVKKLFYNTDNTAKYAYDENGKSTQQFIVNVNLKPVDGRPEVADVTLKISLEGLIYPTANYTMDQRIERYWFKKWTDDIATDKKDRYEVHANVDVVGQKQTVNTALQADDDFFFDASSFFVKNEFQFVPTNPFNWASTINNEAPLYFNSSAYDVVPTVGTAIASPKEVVFGASGAKYALYLTNAFSLKLMATQQLADGTYKTSADDQVVVELIDGDKVAPNKPGLKFHELVKFMGKRDDTYSYARDLLNYSRHNELGDEKTNDPQTFTTHMIFADNNELSCLPIALGGNRTFDIRYLRPLSASKKLPKIIEDAVDGGTDATKIYLTDIASFEDWRKIKFTAENHMDYLYYYGVKKIVADFDKARTNLNGGANLAYDATTNTAREMTAADEATAAQWPLITEVTSKLKFEPDAAAQTPASALERTNSYNTFKYTNCGYYEYQNNAGNVGTFQIYIPISIIYDWGQTKEEYVLVTITRTKGQDITGRARQN